MKRLLIILYCFLFVMSTPALSQTNDSIDIDALPDTALAFSLNNFYYLVTRHHPVARQADLLSELARQEIRLARGNFDPKLEVEWLKKNFNDTEYYNILNAQVKLPAYFPVDPSIGIDQNSGAYLNPERYISDQYNYQQLYAGVSIPLGRGLFTDERRTALKQANLFRDMTEAEQVKMINKLLLEAAKDYWQWYYAYYNFRLMNRNVIIAEEIYRRVKLNTDLGEAAPVDTIQARITLQQRLVEQQEALLEFNNTGIQLSNYLWDSLANPLQLSPRWAPVLEEAQLLSPAEVEQLAEQARQNHPELRKLRVKLQQLEVDRRLAAEFLKPEINISYYLLNQPFSPVGETAFNPGEDYKLGLDFSFPLFIRKERAKLAQTKVKIASTEWEQTLTERQIVNQINATYNEMIATQGILLQQTQMVDNYERLLRAELINLENGESDLFKINIQQEKLIQSQNKLIKLKAEYEKQKATLYWAAGNMLLADSAD